MPVSRRLVVQSLGDSQLLGVDSPKRFVVNNSHDWQMLLGPKSSISESDKEVKLHAKFNTDSFDDIQLIAYLFDSKNNDARSAGSAIYQIYQISTVDWTETLIHTVSGTAISGNYFYSNVSLSSLLSASLDGDTSLRVDVSIIRGSKTYNNRIYVNHLGVYDSVVRLRKEIQFLDLTKLDE